MSFESLTGKQGHLEAGLKLLRVLVCTSAGNINGYIYGGHQQRLSDVLNQTLVPSSIKVSPAFIPLVKASLELPNGKVQPIASIYVRKASILFVCEKSDSIPTTEEAGFKQRIYPVKPKKSMWAEITLPSFTLTGKMYGGLWQDFLDSLDQRDTFLPLTDVRVWPGFDSAESSEFDFVAVNKEQIIHVGESITNLLAFSQE
jgi:hypothetical protein